MTIKQAKKIVIYIENYKQNNWELFHNPMFYGAETYERALETLSNNNIKLNKHLTKRNK